MPYLLRIVFTLVLVYFSQNTFGQKNLESLFYRWRDFEKPPTLNGAPDYRIETFNKRKPLFERLEKELLAIDTSGWVIKDKVNWHVLRAEMHGYAFNQSILKPWERDPAFYKSIWMSRSDVPAHEGPTHHGITEVWMYTFPLDKASREKFLADIQVIVSINTQAKINLVGNAKDLWIAGIRDIQGQVKNLEKLKSFPGISKDLELLDHLEKAKQSTQDLVIWLQEKASTKTGPSGIGKENYTWYQQNVHLVPLTWEDEVMLLKRELARAWSALKLEEHRNRHIAPLKEVTSPEEYNLLAKSAAKSFLRFLREEEIVTVKEYFEPALNPHLGSFIPRETRNFFYITTHYDPRPLYSHFYHWFELARMDLEPHPDPIRREALLYNLFDSRNEGLATAVEELFLQAGMYEESPRVKELVYILLAQRAARGLGSLYAHANEMSMEEAGKIHSEYTPRGWMKTEPELLLFEQHLYLRQPGYGTSYVTGKFLLENAMAEYAKILETNNREFKVKDFLDRLNEIGCIPASLAQWELTGKQNF